VFHVALRDVLSTILPVGAESSGTVYHTLVFLLALALLANRPPKWTRKSRRISDRRG
jgi:hypothetical protein